jgi:dCTP deaminase
MILDRRSIIDAMSAGSIAVRPYDPDALRSNSYDVHLSPWLSVHRRPFPVGADPLTRMIDDQPPLDCAADDPVDEIEIPREGLVLQPGRLYLGATLEYTEAHNVVPWLDGKSSGGRKGLFIHVTAGRGDLGFCGHWTLEIIVVEPLRVYAGMPVGQLTWFAVQRSVTGPSEPDYGAMEGSKYQNQGAAPVASKMHKNFPLPGVWLARAEEARIAGRK